MMQRSILLGVSLLCCTPGAPSGAVEPPSDAGADGGAVQQLVVQLPWQAALRLELEQLGLPQSVSGRLAWRLEPPNAPFAVSHDDMRGELQVTPSWGRSPEAEATLWVGTAHDDNNAGQLQAAARVTLQPPSEPWLIANLQVFRIHWYEGDTKLATSHSNEWGTFGPVGVAPPGPLTSALDQVLGVSGTWLSTGERLHDGVVLYHADPHGAVGFQRDQEGVRGLYSDFDGVTQRVRCGDAQTMLFAIAGRTAYGALRSGTDDPWVPLRVQLLSGSCEPGFLGEDLPQGVVLGVWQDESSSSVTRWVGSAPGGEGPRAFSSDGSSAEWLALDEPSEARDVYGQSVLGVTLAGSEYSSWLQAEDELHPITSAWALQLDLHGLGRDWYAGRGQTLTGQWRPLLARPWSLPSAARLEVMPEPHNARLQHACVHTQEGPFRVLMGSTEPQVAPRVDTPHTSYSVGLDANEPVYLNLGVPAHGVVSMFFEHSVPVQLRNPQGQAVAPDATVPTASCSRIRWVHQYRLDAGDHLLALGPTLRTATTFVVEHSVSVD